MFSSCITNTPTWFWEVDFHADILKILCYPSISIRHSHNNHAFPPHYASHPRHCPTARQSQSQHREDQVYSCASAVRSSVDNNMNSRFVLRYLKTKIQVNPKGETGNEEPEICAVCRFLYEENMKNASLHCGHEFHVDCIKMWLLQKNECPMCRETTIPINVNKPPTHRFYYRVECYDWFFFH